MVIQTLENIASTLESKGLLKEATQIDVVCNTLEKQAFNLFKNRDKKDLEGLISERVKDKPAFLANKTPMWDKSKEPHNSSEERFRTKISPKDFKDRFKEGPDGFWYLQDVDDLSVHKNPGQKDLVVYDDGRDSGSPIPGLEPIPASEF